LTCPFFNLMWKEKLIGEVIIAIHHLVDARSSSSISSKISPSLEVEVKLSLLEEKTRRHNLTWVQIERMQVWEELSLYSYHESRCLHLKLSFMILDISPKPQHKPL
jgi:proteasome assembly chaperone (PAC2) family protein